jgi:hypothetical protein
VFAVSLTDKRGGRQEQQLGQRDARRQANTNAERPARYS